MKAPLVVTFFNVIESATFHRFLQLREQEEVAWSKVRGEGRVWEQQNVVFRQKFVVTALWAGALSWCRIQLPERLLRAMSAHTVAEALQDCFVEFLIYCPLRMYS
jgi:hypothetical protein